MVYVGKVAMTDIADAMARGFTLSMDWSIGMTGSIT
jgi:hypothetical protein